MRTVRNAFRIGRSRSSSVEEDEESRGGILAHLTSGGKSSGSGKSGNDASGDKQRLIGGGGSFSDVEGGYGGGQFDEWDGDDEGMCQ